MIEAFIESILRDIRMERTKIRPSDNIRVFYLSSFFIEYLLLLRHKLVEKGDSRRLEELPLGLVAQIAEMDSVKWLFARLRICWDDKPKAWTELQACIECFTQIACLSFSNAFLWLINHTIVAFNRRHVGVNE